MCLGVPGKIIDIYEANGLKMCRVDFGGVVREVCLAYVPEAEIGDFAVIHVGFAISLLDEVEAQATLETLRDIASIEEELGVQAGTNTGQRPGARKAGAGVVGGRVSP